jgi:Zn-dependent protease
MQFDPETIRLALLNLIILIISLSLHEWGHAYVADRLGDNTPRSQGRVTLNPIAHIELIGTIVIPLLASLGVFGGFGVIGWAKPVWTNPSNFANRVRDQAWVTIAGPAVNLGIALMATIAAGIAERVMPSATPFFLTVLKMNVLLVVFNLLPIPPLDGSKFLMYWFGMAEETYLRFAQWGWILLLVLINVPAFGVLLKILYSIMLLPFDRLYSLIT